MAWYGDGGWAYYPPYVSVAEKKAQGARALAKLDPNTDEYKFARAALVRERNRAVHALDSASSVVDEILSLEDRR